MEEINPVSKVYFTIDTTSEKNCSLSFPGQSLFLDSLRSMNEKCEITIEAANVTFLGTPVIKGVLRLKSSGFVSTPCELDKDHFDISAFAGVSIWKHGEKSKQEVLEKLGRGEEIKAPPPIQEDYHSVARLAFLTTISEPMSAKLPGCNVIIGKSTSTSKKATFSLEAENILTRIDLRCNATISFLHSDSLVAKGNVYSGGSITLDNRYYIGMIPEWVYPLFHLPKPE